MIKKKKCRKKFAVDLLQKILFVIVIIIHYISCLFQTREMASNREQFSWFVESKGS